MSSPGTAEPPEAVTFALIILLTHHVLPRNTWNPVPWTQSAAGLSDDFGPAVSGSGICSLPRLHWVTSGCPALAQWALGESHLRPWFGIPWSMGTKQQHPLLGPGSEGPLPASHGSPSSLYSHACRATLCGSHDLHGPTFASLTHLHGLAHAGLANLASQHCPISLGHIH